MALSASCGRGQNCSVRKTSCREGERTRTPARDTAIQMPAICSFATAPFERRMRIATGARILRASPRSRMFECLSRRSSAPRPDLSSSGACFKPLDQARNTALRRRGLSRRLGIILAGDRKRLLEVLDIEPRLGADAFQNAVFPQPGALDVELALLLLIARLDAVTGDGPLSAHPKDVAMQGHWSLRFRFGCRRRRKTRIPGRAAFATSKAGSLR